MASSWRHLLKQGGPQADKGLDDRASTSLGSRTLQRQLRRVIRPGQGLHHAVASFCHRQAPTGIHLSKADVATEGLLVIPSVIPQATTAPNQTGLTRIAA
jgi:hypothetical protein